MYMPWVTANEIETIRNPIKSKIETKSNHPKQNQTMPKSNHPKQCQNFTGGWVSQQIKNKVFLKFLDMVFSY